MRKRAVVAIMLLAASQVLPADSGFAAEEEKKVNIKISAAIPTSLPVLKTIHDFAANLDTMSKGTIRAKIYDPGKLVPAMEIHDAVSKGQVTAGYTFSMYLAGKIPASPLFASMPFGPSANAYTAWLFEGNGLALYQRMYDEAGYNLKVFPIGISDTESGGWFREEINSVEDLKGLRLRWPALGGKVMSKLGASVSTISIAEVFPALEKGAVDGTECGLPIVDAPLGFWKVAKYNYFPGWHQTSTVFEFILNKDVWESMSSSQQAILEAATRSNITTFTAKSMAFEGKVLQDNAEKHGVINKVYPPEVIDALHKAWLEVVAEESEKDAFFKEVWDDLSVFMKQYNYWQEHNSSILPR